MRLTSLSTKIGASNHSDSTSGTTTPSHPGMMGGWTTVPVAKLDRAGDAHADSPDVTR